MPAARGAGSGGGGGGGGGRCCRKNPAATITALTHVGASSGNIYPYVAFLHSGVSD